MKFIIFITAFSLIVSNIRAQNHFYFESCEDAKKQAVVEAESGAYYFITGDAFGDDGIALSNYLSLFIYSNYNIKTEFRGCMEDEYEKCYDKTMDSLINQIFGQNFIENIKIKLLLKFDSMSVEEKSQIIKLSVIYDSNLESDPKFIGNDQIIADFLRTIFVDKDGNEPLWTTVLLTIDENGELINIEPDNDYLSFKNQDDKINLISKLNNLGKWIPGFIYNKKVKSKVSLVVSKK